MFLSKSLASTVSIYWTCAPKSRSACFMPSQVSWLKALSLIRPTSVTRPTQKFSGLAQSGSDGLQPIIKIIATISKDHVTISLLMLLMLVVIAQAFEELLICIRQRSVFQQVRSMLKRAYECLFPPPLCYFAVIPRKQHFRHVMPPKFGRTGVMWVFEQT